MKCRGMIFFPVLLAISLESCNKRFKQRVEERPGQVVLIEDIRNTRLIKPNLDSTVFSIVPDSVAADIRKQLNMGNVWTNMMLNKDFPHSLPFSIISSEQICVEYYYLAFRDNFVSKRIDRYSRDTIFFRSGESKVIESKGTSMVFFKARLFVSVRNAKEVKAVTFLD